VALVVLYAVVGCRLESTRTWAQVDILRDALAGGSSEHQTESTHDWSSGFSTRIVKGAWGRAYVRRPAEEVLETLEAGSRAAGISPPLCVALDDRKREDLTRSRSEAKNARYACEPIRNGRAYGWVLVSPSGRDSAGHPVGSWITYGLGPNAGGLRLSHRWPDG
jgi:hypothetical protein